MTEMLMALNCYIKKSFKDHDADIKHPLFPINGRGIVIEKYCGKSIGKFSDGYAKLTTDSKREKLFCKNIDCIYFTKITD